MRIRPWFCRCGVILLLCAPLQAAEWPAYRHDAQRSGVTAESLTFPLRPAWRYRSAHPPAPAWRSTPKTYNQLVFDYAMQPVVAGGLVCFGSSMDDTLRALDAATGEERWHFAAGGPIRFAPEIADGRLFVASDDGWVYCLELATGKALWSFRAAPSDERLLGDDRMISRWPCRNGVLVDGGVVFVVAGMWPTEGVFIYALEAATGKPLWCHDTGGITSPWEAPSSEIFFQSGMTPQGPLLASAEILVVPMGRAMAATVDRKTGRVLRFQPSGKYAGGGYPVTLNGEQFAYYTGSDREAQRIFTTSNIRRPGMKKIERVPQPGGGSGGEVSLIFWKDRVYARQAFSLALAGETLIAGERDAVAAYDAQLTAREKKNEPGRYDPETQTELWRAPVDGSAYGLAVADGRLYVATDRGELVCFGREEGERAQGSGFRGRGSGDGAGGGSSTVNARRSPTPVQAPASGDRPAADNRPLSTVTPLRSAGMDRGYALVVGDRAGATAMGLAQETDLRVITVVPDAATAHALRERLLATTDWHGTRIQVFEAQPGGRLPFAQFFANAVVRVGEGSGVAPTELYRVLRPCGGIWLCPQSAPAEAEKVFQASGAAANEIRWSDALPCVVRGKLPGAADWDTPSLSDRYLKGPLRPLWFGGPDPMEQYDRLTGYPTLTAAAGRYFYLVRGSLAGVDAYNGVKLWERSVPLELRRTTLDGRKVFALQETAMGVSQEETMAWRAQPPAIVALTADPTNVFLTLGKSCFGGQGPACIRLDARTGAQRAVYGVATSPTPVFALTAPLTWTVCVDEAHSATVAMSAERDGVRLELTTRDPSLTPDDGWSLYFDFRPAAERFGLYDRGVFSIAVLPEGAGRAAAVGRLVRGEPSPALTVTGTPWNGGTRTIIRLPWLQPAEPAAGLPQSFGFAAALRSKDADDGVRSDDLAGKRGVARKRAAVRALPRTTYLFADEWAEVLNNGWATLVLPGGEAEVAAAQAPAVLAGPLDRVPAALRKTNIRFAYYLPDAEAQKRPRLHPLTGEAVPKKYVRGNGCGAIFSSAFSHYMRSSSVGVFDLLDDAGLWSFGGVRPSCGQNMLASQGLLMVGDDLSACSCQYAFQTPFVLAPAERRLAEDWKQFFDFDADCLVRTAALNLGAPGDRRDTEGVLWLGCPRRTGGNGFFTTPGAKGYAALNGVWPRMWPYGIAAPLRIEALTNLGPYRFNADRTPIRHTDRPWLYASGYRGIRKAVLTVDFRQPLISQAIAAPPDLDGRIEPAWGEPAVKLKGAQAQIFLRHDDRALYVAARGAPVQDEKGRSKPWRQDAQGEDARVWDDHSIELFLADRAGSRVAHFGVSITGARFEALAAPGAKVEDARWTAPWTSAATSDADAYGIELAVPLASLKAAGLDPAALSVNLMANQRVDTADGRRTQGEALCYLGPPGRGRCANLMPFGLGQAPAAFPPRAFTVRLHFAEPDTEGGPGRRVFDVKLQGQTVLKDFDVAKEAGGVQTALVKEFTGVKAGETLTLEFTSAAPEPTAANAPLLCALEAREEAFAPPAVTASAVNALDAHDTPETGATEPDDPSASPANDTHE